MATLKEWMDLVERVGKLSIGLVCALGLIALLVVGFWKGLPLLERQTRALESLDEVYTGRKPGG